MAVIRRYTALLLSVPFLLAGCGDDGGFAAARSACQQVDDVPSDARNLPSQNVASVLAAAGEAKPDAAHAAAQDVRWEKLLTAVSTMAGYADADLSDLDPSSTQRTGDLSELTDALKVLQEQCDIAAAGD